MSATAKWTRSGPMMGKRRKRRFWSDEEKAEICRQTAVPGVSISRIARRYDVNANQVDTSEKGLIQPRGGLAGGRQGFCDRRSEAGPGSECPIGPPFSGLSAHAAALVRSSQHQRFML